MSEDMILTLGSQAIKTVIFVAGPILISAMITGIVVSVFQAITQINEATLTFIPKMVAVFLVLIVTAPWMLKILNDYAATVFGSAGDLIR